HVGKSAAPGRADPPADGEDIVRYMVDPPASHDAAQLDPLAEGDDVGLEAELLVGPGAAGCPHSSLDLVQDEQRIVLPAQMLYRTEEFGAHMVVAALTLDRFGDERGDVARVGAERG